MKIMVTGGAGFIGSHVVDLLDKMKIPAIVVDNLSTGRESNLKPGIEFVKSDCENIPSSLLDEVSTIIHLACQPRCNVSLFLPEEDAVINYLSSLRFLKKCLLSQVKRIVFVSSMSVYGKTNQLPYTELMSASPRDPYAIHKWALEKIFSSQCELHGKEVVIVRPQHVFGARQRADLSYRNVIARWLRRAFQDEPLPVIGSVKLERAFSPVSLVSRGVISAAITPNISGEIFNLGSMRVRSLEEILLKIQELVTTKIKPIDMPSPRTLLLKSYGSVFKARQVLDVYEYEGEFDENFLALAMEIKDGLLEIGDEVCVNPEVMPESYFQIYGGAY